MMIEQSRRLLQVEDTTSGTDEVPPSSPTLNSSATDLSTPLSPTNNSTPCQYIAPCSISYTSNLAHQMRSTSSDNQLCTRWIHKRDIKSAPAELIRRRQKLSFEQRLDIVSKIMEVSTCASFVLNYFTMQMVFLSVKYFLVAILAVRCQYLHTPVCTLLLYIVIWNDLKNNEDHEPS